MTTISKEEYLKKYLNPVDRGDYKKKKKKRNDNVKVKSIKGMKIVDDDDDTWKMTDPEKDDFPDKLLTEEEKPQIEVIDNRTKEERILDGYRKSDKWKSLRKEDEHGQDDVGETRHDSDSDLEMSRPQRYDSDSDMDDIPRTKNTSTRTKQLTRHDSDSDVQYISEDNEKFRKGKHVRSDRQDSSDNDLDDIPRTRHKDSLSKSRKLNERDRNNDIEVPRRHQDRSKTDRKKRHDSPDSDLDLPRNKNGSSQTRRKKVSRNDSTDSDIDVPRPRRKTGEGQRQKDDSDLDVRRKRHDSNSGEDDKKKKRGKGIMSTGGAGGLTSRETLRKEIEEKKFKESEIDKLAKETRDNVTVLREKGGKKRDLNREKKEKEAEEAVKMKKIKKYDKWGKGLVQDEMQSTSISDLIHESNKPLARYRDDADLDAYQRSVVRDGDPMAKYLAKKQNKENSDKPAFPKYRGPAPAPNRFSLQPGYRWDGVDRSNGFEKKYYQSLSDRKATTDEAYKWSVEDM